MIDRRQLARPVGWWPPTAGNSKMQTNFQRQCWIFQQFSVLDSEQYLILLLLHIHSRFCPAARCALLSTCSVFKKTATKAIQLVSMDLRSWEVEETYFKKAWKEKFSTPSSFSTLLWAWFSDLLGVREERPGYLCETGAPLSQLLPESFCS